MNNILLFVFLQYNILNWYLFIEYSSLQKCYTTFYCNFNGNKGLSKYIKQEDKQTAVYRNGSFVKKKSNSKLIPCLFC